MSDGLPAFNAVVLDMDGVIVDSEMQWKLLERPILGTIVPNWKEEDFERIVGLGVNDLYHLLKDEYGLAMPQDAFLSRCDELAEEVYSRKVSLASGLHDVLLE